MSFIFEMQTSDCYISHNELSNKYTAVSNLKSYIFPVQKNLGINLFGVKIDYRNLIVYTNFTVHSVEKITYDINF